MLNIGICDDRPILREHLMMLIHEYEIEKGVHFNLYQFGSGEGLLEKFKEDKNFFDLFFLDNYMQGLTGLETALCVRRGNPACHIVFVTATDEEAAFMAASPLRILSKPAQKEDIESILDVALAWKTGKIQWLMKFR